MLLTTRLRHNCLCLIKIHVYPDVTIKQTAVIDYQIEVKFVSILTLKAIDCTLKSKSFSSQSMLQAFKRYICIYKGQKGHPKFVALLRKEHKQSMEYKHLLFVW